MRWKWVLSGTLALIGCIDFGGKLDTPIEGGNGGALGNGTTLGASGDGGAPGTYACDLHGLDSTCTTYASGTSKTDAQASCSGKLLETTCPTAGSVGRCAIGGTTDVYYSDGATPHTAADAKADCAFSGGTFSN
ncbi:MAG: hypothetical protein U0270_22500 [Labilithrix sp.]